MISQYHDITTISDKNDYENQHIRIQQLTCTSFQIVILIAKTREKIQAEILQNAARLGKTMAFRKSLKVHKIENFFDSDFGICVISLLVMSEY